MRARGPAVLTMVALTITASGGLPAASTALAPVGARIVPSVTAGKGAPREREVEIVSVDYSFRLPRELPAGRTIFRLVNQGKVWHELNIVLLARGVAPEQFIAATGVPKPDAATIASMVEATVGVLIAAPRQRAPGELATELLPGRTYSVRCIFRDSPTGPRHQALGMYSAIRVTPARAAPSPAVHADTIVASDYVFQRYPRTLPPGPHEFAFRNIGKQRHEVLILLLKSGVTPPQLFDSTRAGRDRRDFVDATIGVLHSRAGTTPVGTLRADLLPGREYLILCTFADADSAPPHFTMGMWGSIRVGSSAR